MSDKNRKLTAVMIIVIVSITMVFIFVGSKPKTDNNIVKIGVCAYKGTDTFISSIITELERIIKEEEKSSGITIKVDIADARESQASQEEQVERYISLKYDVICLNIVDRTSAAAIIDKAAAAEIPLIFFNREPVTEDILRSQNVYYIGSDAKKSAVLQGEMIQAAYQNEPGSIDINGDNIIQYLMVEGESGHQDTIIRTEYAVKTLESGGMRLKKVGGFQADFDRSQAAALMEKWLADADEPPELVISNNDDMALGVADAMKNLHKEKIAIVGIDGIPAGIQAVDEGEMLGTVVSDAGIYAETIFAMAYALGKDEPLPSKLQLENSRYIWIPWQTYMKR